ncbi:hypothetical protein JTE90_017770 [Oedothorax gibbosus]|uniref:Uncharacterized protein n=1 Tax=Oedothorax gibbosus TaxID=931172 RepID=A0AAV6UMR5_9ARAC|nr:hypothetical protein JTE90_017770 [Oedothorax gibbosus]
MRLPQNQKQTIPSNYHPHFIYASEDKHHHPQINRPEKEHKNKKAPFYLSSEAPSEHWFTVIYPTYHQGPCLPCITSSRRQDIGFHEDDKL